MNVESAAAIANRAVLIVLIATSVCAKDHNDTIDLGDVTARITAAKLLKNGDLDIYLTFINKTEKDLWIVPGMSASASDDQGNSYSLRSSTGFARQSQSLKPGPDYGNVYLRLPPKVPTSASFQFHCAGLRGENVQAISFKSSLTILRDFRERTGYDTSIAIVDYKLN